MAVLSFMGSPWYGVETSPEQEAVAVLLPQTHPGPLREADWAELDYGTFEASQYAEAPSDALQDLLHTFDEELMHVETEARSDVQGFMIIEDWQTGLKKITLRITWTNTEDGSAGEFSQTTYLHQDSNYGQGE
jgi:hypothetical protein